MSNKTTVRVFDDSPREFLSNLIAAKAGDEVSMLALLKQSELLINRYSKQKGFIDPDLKQHLIADWLHVVKTFDLERYF